MMSVSSVYTSPSCSFGKALAENIYLPRGCGVEGDIHCTTSPNPSNLRQVHLIASELLRDLAKLDRKGRSYGNQPGALGENILTQGIDLIRLSEGTRLHFGNHEGHAVIRITGLRNPKKRLNEWPAGLLDRCAIKKKKGDVVGRKVDVMGVVEEDGYVMSRYAISIEEPSIFKGLNNV